MPGFGHLINISGQIDENTDAIEDLITKIPHVVVLDNSELSTYCLTIKA